MKKTFLYVAILLSGLFISSGAASAASITLQESIVYMTVNMSEGDIYTIQIIGSNYEGFGTLNLM